MIRIPLLMCCVLTAGASELLFGQEKPKFALPPAPGTPPAARPAAGSKPAGEAAKPGEAKERTPVKLDIKRKGRPEGKELNVPARYYLWSDPDGWHLRSCTKDGYVAKFNGEITLKGGTFEKFRPIELEPKGKHPDAWQVSPDRTQLKFAIQSSDHPDGFDFTVKGKDATVVFDLKVGGKEQPKRIFIGHDNLHPSSTYFEFPAKHD